MHGGQAAETDGLAVSLDPLGQRFAGFETLRLTGQRLLAWLQHQSLEGFERAGAIVTGIQTDLPAGHAELFPASYLAAEHLGQLRGGQLGQRIVRVNDYRHCVQSDDLFGAFAAKIA